MIIASFNLHQKYCYFPRAGAEHTRDLNLFIDVATYGARPSANSGQTANRICISTVSLAANELIFDDQTASQCLRLGDILCF